MARAIWTGVITFGLVSVPVGLYTATEEHEPSFHQFQEGTQDRIRYKRVNERTGREVDYDRIVKGADVGGGKYVMITDEDLESIAPGRSRSLDISGFVDIDDIDPIHYNKAYYLAPAGDESKRTYALLRDAMADANRAGIASFVMHGKEHLAAIRADGNVLVLETLFFADEVRNPKEVLDGLPGKVSFRGQELKMAKQLITSMATDWRPARYRDTYTDRVNDLISSKRKGTEFEPADEAPGATNVVDLMDALRRSVESAGAGRASKTGAKKSGVKKSGAKKTGAKKSAAKGTAKKSTAKKSTAKKSTAKKSAGGKKSTARKAS